VRLRLTGKLSRILEYQPGKKQGHIGLGNILIEFIAGAAWYNIDGSNIWSKVPGFVMSATADVLYSLSVPASTFNFTRKLKIDGTLSDPLNTTNFKVDGTIAGIIVQDGVTQPFHNLPRFKYRKFAI
jgi:hypothetical protein